MNIFRQLRWKLTLSYTLVTISAFLVVLLIAGGWFFTQIFIPNNIFNPAQLVETVRQNSAPLWSHVLSQSPVDTELVKLLLENANGTITGFDFLRVGEVQFSVRTVASLRGLIFGADGTLLGKSAAGFPPAFAVGQKFDVTQIQGLQVPFNAALAGETNSSRLYAELEANNQILMAIPLFKGAGGNVVGVIVAIFDSIPTQSDIPANILDLAGRSLLIFLLATGMVGAAFGAIIANGLDTRFKRLSNATDAWSEGDFSTFIDDSAGDEVAQFAGRLNNMAGQLQGLLRRRQEMAVSEERNRLARDLHDSAKQQALAASFQLGTALTLYERDPQGAKQHLLEADTLVDAVRKELTNLVHELRPLSFDGQDFSETLKEYALEWSHRSGIELKFSVEGNDELAPATRETLFRIAQEALANVARHSSARHTGVLLEFGIDNVRMSIKDDGCGFDTAAQQDGLGLSSMRERAEVSGGSFSVESAAGQGTQIEVFLPAGNK